MKDSTVCSIIIYNSNIMANIWVVCMEPPALVAIIILEIIILLCYTNFYALMT